MSKLFKILLLVAALCALCYFYAPARLLAIVALGRSPVCPVSRAIHSADELRTQVAYKDRILYSSKKLENDPAGYHLWDTPHGRFWIPQGSDFVLPFNLAEQDRKIYGVGEQDVQAGDIVLDCGANVGVYTRVALKNGAKLVVAIEPAPENIECLRRNFAAEIAAGRVILYQKGVWDKDEMLVMRVDPTNSAADSFIIRRKGAVETQQLPLTTIDKLVAELKLERVDHIKMDIEGAEQRALVGARETLAKYHPRLSLAAYHVPSDPVKIPELVRQAWPNYRMECGPCAEANGHVRPDVLYFR
jgi:FkbM family methyltransferase